MSQFTNPLTVEFLKRSARHRDTIRLVTPLVWEVGELGSGQTVVIPVGFACDGSSIPRLFWPIIGSPLGRSVRAGVLHDYLTRTAAGRRAAPGQQGATEFRKALQAEGINMTARWAMWAVIATWTLFRHGSSRLGPSS